MNNKKIYITTLLMMTTVCLIGAITDVYAQKYSDMFKEQTSQGLHPCVISGNPNLNTMVVQLRSDNDEDGQTTDDCLAYVDILIEKYGYKMFDVLDWGDDEYTWTLN